MQNLYHIYPLEEEKCFDQMQAYQLVEVFLAISRKSQNEINALNAQLATYRNQLDKYEAIQFRINLAIQKWSDKVKRLGGYPLALYKVKIPTHNGGSFLWEFPKADIEFLN